jgi:hypothetical protein
MNADIPPLKIWIESKNLTGVPGQIEHGYAFAIQSYKNRAIQFHVLLESGAHFRHIPLHWLFHNIELKSTVFDLQMLQLWNCFSYKPIVTVFDFFKGYQCDVILKDKTQIAGRYWFTIDWLPDSESESGFLLQPDQNKCAHVILLENGQIAALPTNRLVFKDAFFVGNKPLATTKNYKTIDSIHQAEDCNRWSVANTDQTFY